MINIFGSKDGLRCVIRLFFVIFSLLSGFGSLCLPTLKSATNSTNENEGNFFGDRGKDTVGVYDYRGALPNTFNIKCFVVVTQYDPSQTILSGNNHILAIVL